MLVALTLIFSLFGSTYLHTVSTQQVQQQQFNSISGYVFDEQRNPVPDLQVELLNDMDSILQRTKTDSSGLFVFRRVANGIFQVRIQTFGTDLISQTQRVQIERTGAVEQFEFRLANKRTSGPSVTPGVVFIQKVPTEAKQEFERGSALLKKDGQQKDGLAALQKAVELFPDYFAALEVLGSEYVKQQKYDQAAPLLIKAVEVNRQAHQSLYLLSVAQYNLKQVPEAVETMKRAITLTPQSSTANLWLGMLLRQSSKLDEAETYLKEADRLASSKSPDVHWQLALLFNDLKRYKESADELELFLKVAPDAKDKELIQKLIQRLRDKATGK